MHGRHKLFLKLQYMYTAACNIIEGRTLCTTALDCYWNDETTLLLNNSAPCV